MADHQALVVRSLTEQQRNFVHAFVGSGNAKDAKSKAGYGDTVQGSFLLRHPAIAAAIRYEVGRQLATEGAQIGYGALKRIALDTQAPAAAQVAAAKALLQGAGLLEPQEKQADSKPLTAYSQTELREFIETKRGEIDRIEATLADRAPVIGSGTPKQAIDPFA
jgi:phage terminase small subunit